MTRQSEQLRQTRTQQLQEASARRAADTLARAQRAIIALSSRGQAITFAAVAAQAAVSESYFYKNPALREEIYSHRSAASTHAQQARQRSIPSTESLRTQLVVTRQRLQTLESEVRDLRLENEVLRGQVVELRRTRRHSEGTSPARAR
jgi:hypothetical protein